VKIPRMPYWVVIGGLVSVGLLLIATSGLVNQPFWKELLRELGVVVLSVFVVSWLYEIAVAKKFVKLFSLVIERSTSLAASCQRLGIIEICEDRKILPAKYQPKQLNVYRVNARCAHQVRPPRRPRERA
jgi:hypothetical protein